MGRCRLVLLALACLAGGCQAQPFCLFLGPHEDVPNHVQPFEIAIDPAERRVFSTSLGSRDYLRVRFGIGRPPGRMDPADYVLRDFSATERRDLDVLVVQCADAVEQLLAHGLAATQNQLH